MNSSDFDKYFPLQGTCFHCGRDLRFHTIMKINDAFVQENQSTTCSDFQVPAQAIKHAIDYNSTKPLGRTIIRMVRAATA